MNMLLQPDGEQNRCSLRSLFELQLKSPKQYFDILITESIKNFPWWQNLGDCFVTVKNTDH